MLPGMISAGGVPIPADASDIHYVTREGLARVSFLSDRDAGPPAPRWNRPAGQPLLDDANYGSA